MGDSTVLDPAMLVDLARYPVLNLDSAAGRGFVDEHAAALRERGVTVVPAFVRDEVITAMVAECDDLAATSHHQDVPGTPYLELPDRSWPDDHPRRTWSRSSVHTVAYDRFPALSTMRALYQWDPLLRLVARLIGRRQVHRYADPLGALNLAVMVEGDVLAWHYDQTDFVVSLAVQSSERGGEFENVAFLRGEDGEEHYDEVARILAGEGRERVVVEPMTPGTLMLFEGRRSLHRVTPVEGPTPRYVALFGYDSQPGIRSSDLLKQVRYGRTEPVAGDGC